jgi:predicted  nucleic acid-binding Zn-ribbon protein
MSNETTKKAPETSRNDLARSLDKAAGRVKLFEDGIVAWDLREHRDQLAREDQALTKSIADKELKLKEIELAIETKQREFLSLKGQYDNLETDFGAFLRRTGLR